MQTLRNVNPTKGMQAPALPCPRRLQPSPRADVQHALVTPAPSRRSRGGKAAKCYLCSGSIGARPSACLVRHAWHVATGALTLPLSQTFRYATAVEAGQTKYAAAAASSGMTRTGDDAFILCVRQLFLATGQPLFGAAYLGRVCRRPWKSARSGSPLKGQDHPRSAAP